MKIAIVTEARSLTPVIKDALVDTQNIVNEGLTSNSNRKLKKIQEILILLLMQLCFPLSDE